MQLDTVKVKREGGRGFRIINKSAFDPKKHELIEDAAAAKGGDPKPSDGLNVEQIKAALSEKQIAIPDGVTKKADLAALLDGVAKGGDQ